MERLLPFYINSNSGGGLLAATIAWVLVTVGNAATLAAYAGAVAFTIKVVT